MRTATKKLFKMIVATCIIFSAGTTTAQMNNGAWELCGCDTREGIEMYVRSLVDEARQRDDVCKSVATHIPACIAVWCSICSGHPGAAENCMTTATDYLVGTTKCEDQRPSEPLTAVFSGIGPVN
ncbi:MAG: hypothetical protein GY820_23975 [Gammaproteobacteria bacterium]|nr:hypothetical protein [Gammaproteobacteria bacterium]